MIKGPVIRESDFKPPQTLSRNKILLQQNNNIQTLLRIWIKNKFLFKEAENWERF